MKKFIFILLMGLSTMLPAQTNQDGPLKVEVSGKGAPLLLIPGLGCAGEVWNSTADSLKDRYECHVLTLPGFAGQPAIAHEEKYLQKVREEIVDYLSRQGLQSVGLIGHSLGGLLSLQLAAEYPERFNAVVVIDAAPFLPALQVPGITVEGARSMAANMKQRMEEQRQQQNPGSREANQRGALHSMVSGKEDLEQILTWNMASDFETVAQAMYELYSTDYRKEIANITAPVLVMGAWIAYKDYGVTKESSLQAYKSQYAHLPGTKVVMSDRAKHFIMYDDPSFYFAHLQQMMP